MRRATGATGLLAAVLVAVLAAGGRAAPPAEGAVRIAGGVSGHIHPAVCVGRGGVVVVIFSQSDFKDLRTTRSEDGGKTWTRPAPVPPTESLSIYPGALLTLRDGRIVHVWNTWYQDRREGKAVKSRHPQFAVSGDDGKTWGPARDFPKNPAAESVLRHAPVERDGDWLVSLSDATGAIEPATGKFTPLGGEKHGLVPIVRTPKGTLVSGAGKRSVDGGKTWERISPFPAIGANGWRFDLVALENGWLVASEVLGPGVGGDRWRFVVSRDDGRSWDLDGAVEFYNPGRPIGGRACPKSVQLDRDTLGTVFYDVDAKQPGGPGVFFLRTPLGRLAKKGG